MSRGIYATNWDRFKEPEDETPFFSQVSISALKTRLSTVDAIFQRVESIEPEVLMIGEGSHGSHEYYQNRIDLTKRLIERGLCQAVMIEGDLPDTSDLHRFVMNHVSFRGRTIDDIFLGFQRLCL